MIPPALPPGKQTLLHGVYIMSTGQFYVNRVSLRKARRTTRHYVSVLRDTKRLLRFTMVQQTRSIMFLSRINWSLHSFLFSLFFSLSMTFPKWRVVLS